MEFKNNSKNSPNEKNATRFVFLAQVLDNNIQYWDYLA
jgi:hypothetical protein